jgi:hypothetical protein
MKLYTYYRSQASFRVRIALNLKGIAREDSFLHLEKGDQFADAYRAINPQIVVPTLIDGDIKLFRPLGGSGLPGCGCPYAGHLGCFPSGSIGAAHVFLCLDFRR